MFLFAFDKISTTFWVVQQCSNPSLYLNFLNFTIANLRIVFTPVNIFIFRRKLFERKVRNSAVEDDTQFFFSKNCKYHANFLRAADMLASCIMHKSRVTAVTYPAGSMSENLYKPIFFEALYNV